MLCCHASQTSFCPNSCQDFNDGSHAKKNCPVFNNEHVIEALFYVEGRRFRKLLARNFQWAGNGPDIFANFEEVMVDTALTNWENIANTIDDADKTAAQFEEVMHEMYCKYIGAKARVDTQLEECFKMLHKPMEPDLLMDSSRILTLARYGNKKMLWMEPPLTDVQVRMCIFHSSPQSWQQQSIYTHASKWQTLNSQTSSSL
jgi:hypothetical protein